MENSKNEIEFVDGLIVKPPHEKAQDFVKARINMKREELIAWLQGKDDEWINLDVKVSQKTGNWYASVYDWKKVAKKDEGVDPSQEISVDDIPF